MITELREALRRRVVLWNSRIRDVRVTADVDSGRQTARTDPYPPGSARERSSIPAGDLDPDECALLLLGCQPGLLADVADHDSLVTKINAAIDIIRLYDGHVLHARLAFEPSDSRLPSTTNKGFSTAVRARQLQNGTPDADLHPALAARPGDRDVRTTRLGAFFTTDLDEQLTNLGVTTLILAGTHTSGALLTTVREAADRDYQLIVLADCTADPDPEVHALLLQRVFPRQAKILTAAQLYASMVATKSRKQQSEVSGLQIGPPTTG